MNRDREILASLAALHQKVDMLMSQQDDINADVTAIEAGVAQLGTAAQAIQAEIAALKQSNPTLDLSGLDQAVADLQGAVTTVQAQAPAPAPPVTPPAQPAQPTQ